MDLSPEAAGGSESSELSQSFEVRVWQVPMKCLSERFQVIHLKVFLIFPPKSGNESSEAQVSNIASATKYLELDEGLTRVQVNTSSA